MSQRRSVEAMVAFAVTTIFPLLLSFVACDANVVSVDPAISPAEGQTSVTERQPLRVVGDFALPPDYAAVAIEVIDAESGGFVRGEIVLEANELRFEPLDGWLSNREYLWTVSAPLPEARQPEIAIPEVLLGTAAFATTNDLHILAALVQEEGELCLISSRVVLLEDHSRVRVSVDDVASESGEVQVADIREFFLPGDAGLGAFCLDVEGAGEADRVRVWVDDHSVSFVVEATTIDAVIARLRRSVP